MKHTALENMSRVSVGGKGAEGGGGGGKHVSSYLIQLIQYCWFALSRYKKVN